MATVCAKCGRELKDPTMHFCGNCGAPISTLGSGASEPIRPDSKAASREDSSGSSSPFQTRIFAVIAGGVLLIIFLYVRNTTRPNPCDSIFEQTAPELQTSLAQLKTKGDLVIGRDKIQDLAESAQKGWHR
jgi:hypothetical protein